MITRTNILTLLLGLVVSSQGFTVIHDSRTFDWTAAASDELFSNSNWTPTSPHVFGPYNNNPGRGGFGAFGYVVPSPIPANFYTPTLSIPLSTSDTSPSEFAFYGSNTFTTSIKEGNLVFTGNGITNNSSVNQVFEINNNPYPYPSVGLTFAGVTSADTTESGKVFINVTSTLSEFTENSTASNANISLVESNLSFIDLSSLGKSKITADGSTINFYSEYTPSSASILLKNSSHINSGNLELSKIDIDETSDIIFMTQTSTFTLDNTEDCTIAGTYFAHYVSNSTHELLKKGPGTLTLSGNNFSSKSIVVEGGTLNLQTTLNQTYDENIVLVRDSGTLSGNGVVNGSVLIFSNGTISPGNSIGTLSVLSAYRQSRDSTYKCEVDIAGNSDLIQVLNGPAFIAGILNISDIDGRQLYYDYTILEASSLIVGTFDTVIDSNPLVLDIVNYSDPRKVTLSFKQNLIAAADTQNEINVANQLDGITTPTTDQLNLLTSLINLPVNQAREALEDLSGDQYTYLIQLDRYGSERFNRRVYNALRTSLTPCWSPAPCSTVQTWFQAEGGQSYAKKDSNCDGLRAQNWDFSLGAFTPLCDGFLVGAAANYEIDHVNFYQGGHTNWHTGQAAIYGAFQCEQGYAFADFIYGRSWGRMKRLLDFDNVHHEVKGTPKTSQGLIYTEVGLDFCLCDLLLQPFVAGEFGFYRQHKISECGFETLGLTVGKKTLNTTDIYVGTHLSSNYGCVVVSADIAWQHRFNNSAITIVNAFQDFGNEFDIKGVKLGNNAVKGTLNFSTELCEGFSLYGELSGEKWKNWSAYGVDLGVSLWW